MSEKTIEEIVANPADVEGLFMLLDSHLDVGIWEHGEGRVVLEEIKKRTIEKSKVEEVLD